MSEEGATGRIRPEELTGIDTDVARKVLAVARSIVPSLHELAGEDRAEALAILLGVAKALPEPGSERVRSMSRNGTSMSFDVGSAFSADDRAALRALAPGAAVPGLPVGRFPEGRLVSQLWPEEPCR